MNWKNPFDGFQLDDYFNADNQIDLLSAVKFQALVRDRKIDLALESQSAKL